LPPLITLRLFLMRILSGNWAIAALRFSVTGCVEQMEEGSQ
jgi:hypothetical protein